MPPKCKSTTPAQPHPQLKSETTEVLATLNWDV
jgi:hypothetical protein